MEKEAEVEKIVKNYAISTQVLGKGAFGICKKGWVNDNINKKLAVKLISKAKFTSRQYELFQREVQNQKILNNDHIVKLIDIASTANNYYIILEYCNGGTLKNYITNYKKKNAKDHLTERESIIIFEEICNAFKSISEKNIVHRDIKPSNILIHNGKIKIADFGFSIIFDDYYDKAQHTILGTPYYQSFEILNGENYSAKCDIFAVGIVLYEMLYGHHPFYNGGENSEVQLLNILKSNKNLKFPNHPKLNDDLKNLLIGMLKIKETERLKWNEVFKHKYFANKREKKLENQKSIELAKDEVEKAMFKNEFYLEKNKIMGFFLFFYFVYFINFLKFIYLFNFIFY